MNFLEAVQALAGGLCDGIRRECWNKEQAYIIIDEHGFLVFGSNNRFGAKLVLGNDWQLVNPKPQTETVEIKRFVVIDSTGCQGTYLSEAKAIENAPNSIVVELTGTYDRTIKPKVKRREEFSLNGVTKFSSNPISNDARFYAEWEE